MATDPRFACPVCSEPHDAPAAECFRCETSLGSWWRFEEAVARLRSREPARGPRVVPLVAAAVLGATVSAVALRTTSGTAPVATTPSVSLGPSSVGVAPSPGPAPIAEAVAPPAVVVYHVQPGDSLWRIAAALTGDGRNWKALWPTTDPARPLAVGSVLEAPVRTKGD